MIFELQDIIQFVHSLHKTNYFLKDLVPIIINNNNI